MAKKSSPKAKKTAGKPTPKGKTVTKKPVRPAGKADKNRSQKTATKAVKKPAKPLKNTAKTAKTVKNASKPAAKPVAVKKAKPVAPAPKTSAKPVKTAIPVKKDTAPAKPVKTAPVVPPVAAAPVKKAPAPKKEAPPVLPAIDTSKLPKLPKGIVVKRGKGKLAPGEKRLVKTDVITHHVLEDKPLEGKQKPEPKGKFMLEYVIRTPVSLLYDFLSTPNGLAEWFADGVDMRDNVYSFEWDGSKQYAKVVSAKLDNWLRLSWLDKPDGYYFEFRLEQDELTNEVSLIVTDFGENEDDIIAMRRLWETQIQRLIKALGTY